MKLRDPEETGRSDRPKATVGQYQTAIREATAAWQRVSATVEAMHKAASDGAISNAANVRYAAGAVLSALSKYEEAVRVLADVSDDMARMHARREA